jgi:hypothetical protein
MNGRGYRSRQPPLNRIAIRGIATRGYPLKWTDNPDLFCGAEIRFALGVLGDQFERNVVFDERAVRGYQWTDAREVSGL